MWRVTHVSYHVLELCRVNKPREFFASFLPPELFHYRIAQELADIANTGRGVHNPGRNVLKVLTLRIIVHTTTLIDDEEKLGPVFIVELFSDVETLKHFKVELLCLVEIELHALVVVLGALGCNPMQSQPCPEKPDDHLLLVVIFEFCRLWFWRFLLLRNLTSDLEQPFDFGLIVGKHLGSQPLV
jgi:hypothetical protein